MFRPIHRRSVCSLAALTLIGLGVGGAAPAQAESFEQISRTTGAQGASAFATFGQPVFASDSGRWAIAAVRPFTNTLAPGTQGLWIRDIVSNQTRALGDPTVMSVLGVDRAEQHALVSRYDQAAGKSSLALVPIAGGATRVLATWNGQLGNLTGAISGDGKTVAFSDPYDPQVGGLFTLTVATGAVKKIDNARVELGPRGISDDGKVIAGRLVGSLQGVYYRGTAKTVTLADTIVSPNGAVVATIARENATSPYQVMTRTLATGVTKKFPLPAEAYDLLWTSVDGRYLATAANRETIPHTPSKILDTATGAWTNLGGPYAAALNESLVGLGYGFRFPAVSRNGRYAVAGYGVQMGNQFALVDLTGADLPGTQEALSASSYVGVSQAQRGCPGEPSIVSVAFGQSRPWIPRPKSATIKITADGATIFDETFPEPGTPDEPDNGWSQVEFPPAATSISFAISVVDAENRTVTGTETIKPVDTTFCW